MSERLYVTTSVISIVTRPFWTWYSRSVKHCKSAEDNVHKLIELRHSWCPGQHLKELAAIPISRVDQLTRLLRRSEFEDTPALICQSSHTLLTYRTWSLAKASAPPDCYAGLLSDDLGLQKACLRFRMFVCAGTERPFESCVWVVNVLRFKVYCDELLEDLSFSSIFVGLNFQVSTWKKYD